MGEVLTRRLLAPVVLTALAVTVAACTGGSPVAHRSATPVLVSTPLPLLDINPHPVGDLTGTGTLRWSIDTFGPQWNVNQTRGSRTAMVTVMNALLPSPTITDEHAAVSFNPAYWLSAKVVHTSPMKVEYVLNPKAHWSNGRPITEADFAAQVKAMSGTDSGYDPATEIGYADIAGVAQGRDKFDVIVTFATPFAEWPMLFNPLYPAEANATPKAFDSMYLHAIPITAGPFKLGHFDNAAQTVTVVRDPKWWGNRAQLDAITFTTLTASAAEQAFADGTIDYDYLIGNVAAEYQLAASSKTGHVTVAGGTNERQLTFHNGGVLADPKVRQAIAMGTDRLALATSDLAGLPATRVVTLDNHVFVPGQLGYQDNTGTVGTYDPSAARAMLDADGWKAGANGYRSKDGHELDIRFTIPAGTASSAREAAAFQPMMRSIGVKVVVTTVPEPDFFTAYLIPGNFDIAPFTWVGTAFPGSGVRSIYVTHGGENYTGMGDPTIDRDFATALTSTDPATYRAKLNDADVRIWNEVHSLMLFQRLDLDGVSNKVANLGSFGFATIDYTKIGFLK